MLLELGRQSILSVAGLELLFREERAVCEVSFRERRAKFVKTIAVRLARRACLEQQGVGLLHPARHFLSRPQLVERVVVMALVGQQISLHLHLDPVPAAGPAQADSFRRSHPSTAANPAAAARIARTPLDDRGCRARHRGRGAATGGFPWRG